MEGDAEEVGGCSREPSGSAGDSGQQQGQQGRLVIGWWGEAGQEWKRQGQGGKVQPKDAIPSVDVFCKVNVVKECRTIFLKARCLDCDLATISSILKSERLGSPARLPPISVIH